MRFRSLHSLISLSVLCLATPPASAQRIPDDQLAADRFEPAPGPDNYLALDGARVGGHLTPSAALVLDYAHRPLVITASTCAPQDDDCPGDTEIDAVRYQATASLTGSLSLWHRVQIGLLVPLHATEGESLRASTPAFDQPYVDIRGGSAFGLGDPRLDVKVPFLSQPNMPLSLAVVAHVSAPLGQATTDDRFLGDDGFTAGGHVVAELELPRGRIAANLGGAYRPEAELLAIGAGSEMRYGIGGSFAATPLVRVLGELMGATRFSDSAAENPLELRAAGELGVHDLALSLGAGVGLVTGVSVPAFRVLTGVAFRPAGTDADRDGISDEKDKCPSEPEDFDGYLDGDGCPEADNDGDGIADAQDACPDEPEDKDGTEDDDGCPDEDNDGDGIADGYDSCPDQPEDKDGDRDDDGCPDNDRDRDGIPDDVDQCPDEPEDTDGYGDEDGCPEADFDGDGIDDAEDFCPDQPEDVNGVEDDDGCPDAGSGEDASAEPPE